MKVLLVTGKLAYPILVEALKDVKGVDVDISVMDVPVAALMDVRYIAERLKDVRGYDVIVLPGLVFGDGGIIEKRTGIPTVKGTEEAWDIKLVLDALKHGVRLSPREPADKFLDKGEPKAILSEIEEKSVYAFKEQNVKIPLRPPPFKIFLEMGDKQSQEDLLRVKDFVDVIVIGFPVGHDDKDEVRRKVREALELGKPIGIDSDSPSELIEGVRSGASFVFNLNEMNLEKLANIKNNATFVVAPFEVENRGEVTISIVNKARELGFSKLIADPVLSPPLKGFVDSLSQYTKVASQLKDVPIMMGILNFTELIDADSVGVNASMVAIAGEIGASCLLTMDKGKTRWSSWEVREASRMISVAMRRSKLPKDVGFDLFVLKDKRRLPRESKKGYEVSRNEPIMDSGFARIYLTNDDIAIEWRGKGGEITLHGKEALSLGRQLLRELEKRNVKVSQEHAIYIGYELAKAEVALSIDKNYIQDKPILRRIPSEENRDT